MEVYLIEGSNGNDFESEQIYVVAESKDNALQSKKLFEYEWDIVNISKLKDEDEVFKVDKDGIEWATLVGQILFALYNNDNSEEYLKTLPYIVISQINYAK